MSVGVVQVGDTTYIDVGNSDQTAKVRAVKITLPKDTSSTFDIESYLGRNSVASEASTGQPAVVGCTIQAEAFVLDRFGHVTGKGGNFAWHVFCRDAV